MNREKVIELAREAELARQFALEVPFVVDRLERFAALIEREVRGDAEPVGYTNEGYKGMQYANAEAYKELRSDFIERNKLTAPLFAHPAPAASAESVASVHIKDGCLIGSQRKSGVDIPDGQYALYPIGTFPAPAVDAEPVGYTNEGYKGMQYASALAYKDIRPDFIERNKLTAPLYKHPTPAVVRQLVDGLAGLIDFIEIDNLKIDQDALRIARTALAASKENGL